MANCAGWRAAASTRGAGRRWSANAGRVDPLGLEMLIMLFGGLVVAVRLGFCLCQQVCAHTLVKTMDLLGSLYCSLMRITSSMWSLSRALCTT